VAVFETEQTKIIFFFDEYGSHGSRTPDQTKQQTNKQTNKQANYISSVIMSSMLTSQQ